MEDRFNGKVVLVTGGNTGMGATTAQAFAAEGARVVIAARKAAAGEQVVQTIKDADGEAIFIQSDVSDMTQIETLIQKTVNRYGRLDIAFNNAGTASRTMELLAEETEADFDKTFAVNTKGVWACMKYEIRQMLKQGGGVIVNTSSVTGLRGSYTVPAAYAASKHAVGGLTTTAALQYADKGIRINTVCPGFILTPMLAKGIEKRPEVEEHMKAGVPMGRMGATREIAETVLWLCSDSGSYVTGQNIVVDGGMLAK